MVETRRFTHPLTSIQPPELKLAVVSSDGATILVVKRSIRFPPNRMGKLLPLKSQSVQATSSGLGIGISTPLTYPGTLTLTDAGALLTSPTYTTERFQQLTGK